MVVREVDRTPFHLKIDGKWVYVSEDVMRNHPGGSAITTYRDKDATTVFHSFHAGSTEAYKWLTELKGTTTTQPKEQPEDVLIGDDAINMGKFDISAEDADKIAKDFDRLRLRVRREGLMDGDIFFYIRKVLESMAMIVLAFYIQDWNWFAAALLMGLAWQQLGWQIHEFCHQQMFKNHFYNDLASYFVGNFMQGFSSGGWKEQHNIHHAATNVVGRDGDLDLLPLWATVVQDLKLVDSWYLNLLPYQHIYWTVALPLLRLSWLSQSIAFVSTMSNNFYTIYRKRAVYEQTALAAHWILVLYQLYCLPDWVTAVKFFLVSQLFGGFLTAHVVTYNHYSADKFPYNSRILTNYPCLQVYTTRNMCPSTFIDWLWGGLNYQIEHHLFPMMPRHNLSKVMPLVKDFCAEHKIPYMVDTYFTGWYLGVEQFANVAKVALKQQLFN